MKLYATALPQLITNIKTSKVSAALFYGPDKGLISHCLKSLSKELGFDARSISYKEAQSLGLDVLLNNATLFGGKELITITDMPTSIDAGFKKLILGGTHHIPLLVADELTPSSSLRKLFESEDILAAMSCYPDDENNIRRLITAAVAKEGRTIEPEAMRYLTYHLSGDRYLIMSELEKLLLFTHDQKMISLDDVRLCISLGIASSPDILCTSFATGKARSYFAESTKLLGENVSVVWIIRALIRYYINLYIVANFRESGSSLEEAMRALKPPIFFKYVDDFKAASAKSDKRKILEVIGLLQKAEIESKSPSASAEGICERLFFESNDFSRS